MSRSKRIHVNFRLQPELFAVIEKESEENNTTTTTTIEKIVQDYAKKHMFVEQMNFLPVSKNILKELFSNCPEDSIQKHAGKLGKTLGREYISFMFHKVDFDSLLKFLNFFLELQGNLRKEKKDNIFSYSVSHNINYRYSCFLKEFLNSLIQSVTKNKVEIEIGENIISISFEGKS